ncbi:hypothetical protein EDC04DRAFT_1547662 [Pisolithus marmoratus]|nr:hypothetical protein EDC04DRAFT_1547662 [Pisolithus marmoratus]
MPSFKSRQGHEVERGKRSSACLCCSSLNWSSMLILQLSHAELNNRASFIDFCQGLLNLNPIERLVSPTGQDASLYNW